mgnify:CR=1 FL=1
MKKRRLITAFISLFFLIVPSVIGFLYDQVYRKSNPYIIQNGIMDFQNKDISDSKEGIRFNGEMEFYYNKWLIRDKITDATPDCYISLPSFWTEKKIDGKSLPRSGFATYRFTIVNLPIGISLTADSDYFYSSFRIYFDNVLIGDSGTPSKEASTDAKDIRFTRRASFKTTSDTMVVTIEVGNSRQAGLVKGPLIISPSITQAQRRGGELFLFLIFGILIGCLLLLTITSIIRRGVKNTIPQFIASLSMLLYWLFSAEGLRILKLVNIPSISYSFYKLFSVAFFGIFLIGCYLWINSSLKTGKKKLFLILNILSCTLFITLIILHLQTRLFLIPYFILIGTVLVETYLLIKKKKLSIVHCIYYCFFYFLLGFITLSIFNDANFFYYKFSYIISSALLVGNLILYCSFFYNVFVMQKNEEKKKQLLEEQSSLKALALREQVNPHKIFNTLSVIEDFYHQSPEIGDRSLTLYSDYLRYGIDSMEKTVVSFENELNNLMDYTDFQNMREGHYIEFLFDINALEFYVPPLTLETIASCFYHHMITNPKETDNYIEVISIESRKNYVVRLVDHREGYFIDKNQEELKNMEERLKITLNGTLIFRYDNKTTEFIILIPKKQ